MALSYALLSREVDSRCASSDGMEGWAARYAELILITVASRLENPITERHSDGDGILIPFWTVVLEKAREGPG